MIGAVPQWSLAIAAFGSAMERWLALTPARARRRPVEHLRATLLWVSVPTELCGRLKSFVVATAATIT
ncbi:hypothetical protein [Jiangella endophytica]|uniref:hypothetical protein n=1 Tax=Jiangella endophytica TaxID=1623398 RepID=UPI0013002E08|nr:hypothetical protein [Jiangella endophytica]